MNEARRIPPEWQDARLAVLEALDRKDEAQAFRWTCFERDLSGEYLRAYLKRLPDFEDIEAEERAMAHAVAHPELLAALAFFLNWPSLGHAARLLIDRQDEVDGDHHEFLAPAAETLAEKHPLDATVALRAMIDFTPNEARQKRYGYAAQHLATCAELAGRIKDFRAVEPHIDFRSMSALACSQNSGKPRALPSTFSSSGLAYATGSLPARRRR